MRSTAAAAALLALAASAGAAELLVFTLSSMPVVNAAGATVHVLDERERIAAALGRGLGRNAKAAEREARRRFEANAGRLAAAAAGNRLAGELGVAKLPAVVVDRRFVVYGIRDVAAAVRMVEVHRGSADRQDGSRADPDPEAASGNAPLTRTRRPYADEGSGPGNRQSATRLREGEQRKGETRTPRARTLPRGERIESVAGGGGS